mmetsp:Transcript_30131/g.102403  ORF Transcript_30131/g.102403 Transcript_30131/m.102403 type:complete len:85 (-) Transcript_30131:114-368(-)
MDGDCCDATKAAFDACIQRKSTSLDGVKYFASGVLVGTSLTVLIPKTFPLFQRQLPFLVLGVGGIFMDQFHVNSACTIESGAPR